jgi:hypothetical protein
MHTCHIAALPKHVSHLHPSKSNKLAILVTLPKMY